MNAGRDQELTLNVFPPRTDSRLYLDRGDQMAVELEGFDLSGAFFRTQGVDGRTVIADIEITDSVDTPKLHPTAVSIDPVQETLTLTLPDLTNHAHSSGEHLVIIIRKGTGMLAPEIPRGFDEKEDPYRVEITFVDSDDGRPPSAAAEENSIAVRNPVSSTVPGATVRVELATFAENVIHGTDEISVDFSGLSVDASFTVPATVTPSTVQIRHGERTYNPSSVLVRGQKVILTVPSGEDIRVQIVGDYTITFSQSAEIKNPFSAGNRIITVSSFVHGNDEDQITAVIRRTTFVTPGEGARGSAFTLEGRGYADGTVTVFDGNDDTIGSGETLASVNTEMGAFQLSLTAKGTLGQKSYRLWTLDSNGVTDATEFTIESSMSFQPDRLGVGSQLKITISDWDDIDPGPTAVTIGGRPAFVTGAQEYEHCFEPTGIVEADDRGVVSLYVNIPAGVPSGIQTVSVYGSGQLQLVDVVEGRDDPISKRECSGLEPGEPKGSPVAIPGRRAVLRDKPNPIASRTIEVAARPLQLIPDTAARGQRITILGSGFDRISGDGRDIRLISVGGREVAEAPSRFEVPSNGDIALTVTVPDGIPDGLNEVRVEGRDESHASGTLTVPEPAVTVAPEQSGRGSRVRVAGTGFIANGLVSLFYGDGGDLANGDEQLGAAVADSKGGFTAEFRVPIDTELGKQHRVTAVALGRPPEWQPAGEGGRRSFASRREDNGKPKGGFPRRYPDHTRGKPPSLCLCPVRPHRRGECFTRSPADHRQERRLRHRGDRSPPGTGQPDRQGRNLEHCPSRRSRGSWGYSHRPAPDGLQGNAQGRRPLPDMEAREQHPELVPVRPEPRLRRFQHPDPRGERRHPLGRAARTSYLPGGQPGLRMEPDQAGLKCCTLSRSRIDATTGSLTTGEAFGVEAAGTYTITVEASDQDGQTETVTGNPVFEPRVRE